MAQREIVFDGGGLTAFSFVRNDAYAERGHGLQYKKHPDNDNVPCNITSGHLYTALQADGGEYPASTCWWVWSGTFVSLGVPASTVITSIRGMFASRFEFHMKRAKARTSAYFAGNTLSFGPLEIRASNDTLMYTLTSKIYCPSRDSNSFLRWPEVGPNIGDQCIDGRILGTGRYPQNWQISGGTITTTSFNSNTSVKIRLNMGFPPVPTMEGLDPYDWLIRAKHKAITLVVIY